MPRNSALLVLAIVGLLSGCADYLNRYETVALAAGDAQKHNMLLQTADPFNPAAQNNHIPTSGKRTEAVMKRYLIPPPPAAAQNVTINVGAGAGGT